jgi:hypothetical protein
MPDIPTAMGGNTLVYVALLGEGVDVSRPVFAAEEPGGYRLPHRAPPDENWAIPPGALVRCETVDGSLHAVEAVATTSHVSARLTLLGTDQGGREGPLLPGYRGQVRFGGDDLDYGVLVELSDTETLAPGQSCDVGLLFWASPAVGRLVAGREFELREGTRVAGRGSITERAA